MKLEQGLKQTIKMGANLQQTINMLQLSAIDIQAVISNELQDNPFLVEEIESNNIEDYKENEDHSETAYEDNYDIEDYPTKLSKKLSSFDDIDPITNLEADLSLKEHVLQQIHSGLFNSQELLIAYHLTDMLEDSGYIHGDLHEVSSLLKCPEQLVLKILNKLQTLEPSGIFARDLGECLRIQLQERNLYSNYYELLLKNLHRIAARDYLSLAKLCSLSESEIRSMINVIKSLNPKPGNNFTNHKVLLRIPDVFIKFDKNKNLIVTLNSESIPKVQIAKDYYYNVKKQVKALDERKFLSEKYHSAGMLISSIEQRNNAILKVAESISRMQRSFFEKGVLHFKPLTLSEIAIDIGMSESTVSRVTSNKYLSCPLGIFEMKYFFSGKVQSNSSSETISTTKVKEIIKKMIDLEDKKVISDEEIAKELIKFNIKIARRTVTKYREQLKIPTAFIRRREKIEA